MTSAAPDLSKIDFPCANCGALQHYAPGTDALRCPYCDHETRIPKLATPINEHDFRQALARLAEARRTQPEDIEPNTIHCRACAASFVFDEDIHAGRCPYCATPVVLGTEHKTFKPKSLLPFKIEEAQAKQQFRKWLKGLWFAPGGLKKYAHDDTRLRGVYVPYWTYDSDTTTQYHGQRGDYYQVPVRYTVVVKGRSVVRTRTVTKIKWTSVQGVVTRYFDDVLIGASVSLPRRITDALEPWHLDGLVPYQQQYLSGFSSQVYQVELDEGFDHARGVMDQVIRQDIARDIGGDVQRIHSLQTQHHNTTFKHLLLPVWTAGFRFKDKEYIFLVNGVTGKVKGDRPYSKWKIFFAVLLGLVLLGMLLLGQGYVENY